MYLSLYISLSLCIYIYIYRPYKSAPGHFTLAVSECYGSLFESFERRTNALLELPAVRPQAA